MPVPAATVLVGHVVSSLLRNLVATGVVVLVAILVGYRPQAGLGGWLGRARADHAAGSWP